MRLALFVLAIGPLLPAVGYAQGLSGLGKPGGLLQGDPKAMAFETEVLTAINAQRKRSKLDPLRMDERLRTFCRNEARMGATGDPAAKGIAGRIKGQGLAPFGHYLQYVAGAKSAEILTRLNRDRSAKAALGDAYTRVGIGAFYVPEAKPYFQITLLMVRDPDPMAGRAGLSPSDTDPVMKASESRFKACYDQALKSNPNLGGTMLLEIIIGSDGRVQDADFKRALNEPLFDACALEVVRSLRFPKPYRGKPVTLRHPMRFTPPQGNRKLGKLTDGQIAGPFRSASPHFKKCYDDAEKKRADLAGTITVAFTITPEGTVKAVEVILDEPKMPPLTTCLLERIRQFRFPKPKFGGEIDVTYPLHFAPSPKSKKGKK